MDYNIYDFKSSEIVSFTSILLLLFFFGCKSASYDYTYHDVKEQTTITDNSNTLRKYKKIDSLLFKWVNATKEGKVALAQNYLIQLSHIAQKEKKQIIEILKDPVESNKSLIMISLVLAGFTNDCSFLKILNKYLKTNDAEILSNTLLAISYLDVCNYEPAVILNILDNEIKDAIILNGIQVLLRHNFNLTYNELQNVVDKFLWHRNPLVQNQIIRIIAKYKLAQYKKYMLDEFICNPVSFIRTNAAIALSQIGDKSIVKNLIDKLNEATFIGKKEVVYVLENLTGQNFGLDGQAWLFWYLKNSEDNK